MRNFIKEMKESINTMVFDAYKQAFMDGDLPKLNEYVSDIEIPKDKNHGDFSVNFAMRNAKALQNNPRKIAEIIISKLDYLETDVEKCEVAGPGFINFYLKDTFYANSAKKALELGDDFGKTNVGNGTKANVEYISANPTGPMHVGNARGGAIGDCMANILSWANYDVTKEFYVNDAGNQIEKFGISLEARFIQLVKGEDAIEFPEDAYHGEDIIESMKAFIKEFGSEDYIDMDSTERKKKFVAFALERNLNALVTDTGKYGINYDVWFRESKLHAENKVIEVINKLKEKGLAYDKDNATWFESTKFGSEKDDVLIRTNGIPTYFAADIAYHADKFERGNELLINVWGADHHGHIERLKGALSALGYNGDKLHIILMQLVRLIKDNEPYRVSKRSGKAISLNDLIDEIGKDAARFFFNLRQPSSHFDFDLDLAVSQSNENPVFYCQYAHARISSILRVLNEENISYNNQGDFTLLKEKEEKTLMEKLIQLPEEIEAAVASYDPSRITKFVLDVSADFHSFYNACRVKIEDEALMQARIGLIILTKNVIKNTLTILGVEAPDSM
ncbi:MAG: arginine--tRNA ligase [Ruminococcaceae bacterium]|nr:arginine--tRNA ligase [Oscillospiraceae bacterium]